MPAGASITAFVSRARPAAARFALLLAVITSAACGFQLRGAAQLPFDTVHVAAANSGIALETKRAIRTGSATQVVEDPKQAQAVLEFSGEFREKEILSLSSAGTVREFQLRYRVTFRVRDARGVNIVAPTTLQLHRDVSFSDAQVLAKEAEEQLLFRDMESDMVQQILRRLEATPRPGASR